MFCWPAKSCVLSEINWTIINMYNCLSRFILQGNKPMFDPSSRGLYSTRIKDWLRVVGRPYTHYIISWSWQVWPTFIFFFFFALNRPEGEGRYNMLRYVRYTALYPLFLFRMSSPCFYSAKIFHRGVHRLSSVTLVPQWRYQSKLPIWNPHTLEPISNQYSYQYDFGV